MSSREKMLERVRQALDRPVSGERSPGSPIPKAGKVLVAIPAGQLVDHFEKELHTLSGSAYRAGSTGELQEILQRILAPSAGMTVAVSRNPLLLKLDLAAKLAAQGSTVVSWPGAAETANSDWGEFRHACFSAQAGITGVDSVLAESGALVLSSATEGSQLVSLAPPLHIALYTRAQVVESLEEALDGAPRSIGSERELSGRSVVFIAGPSRTADIEQISIRGVHGPVQVHAILVEDSCLQEVT